MVQIYVAGICNIGDEEVKRRRRSGWAGLIISAMYLAVLAGIHVDPAWRFLVFFPAMVAASGFLQAHFHFCTGFAHAGVFNFGPVGDVHQIPDAASKQKDRKHGRLISFYALVIAVVIAVAAFVI